jgi:hypothetical protein
MKRNWACMTLLALSLMLAACGSSTSAATTTGTDTAAASASGAAPAQGELSTIAQDIVGILRLEGTDLAVDSTQAATLLPLWQAYRSLLESGTAAPAELEAVQTQIGEALIAKQQDAIAAMNLTLQDMSAMAEQLGVSQTAASTSSTDSSSSRPNIVGGDTEGAPGGGAPPSGGGSMPVPPSGGAADMSAVDTGALDPSLMVSGTPQVKQAATGSQGDRFSRALLDPLIELLKQRAVS